MRLRLRLLAAALLLLVIVGGALYLFGPREPVDRTVEFDPATIGEDLDAYLAAREAEVANLRENAEKEIVWAYPVSRARTPLALVYVHGFSAAKGEVRPLLDEVAAHLGANLFYARLSGHGRDAEALAEPTVQDWLDDLAEALAIGERLATRVVLVGSSTGGTLSVLGLADPALAEKADALVLLSPNFALRDDRGFLLTLPFARDILPLVGGKTFGSVPASDEFAANWTTAYPITALLPMAALVQTVEDLDLSALSTPLLAIFSPNDAIVDPRATVGALRRWGGPVQVLELAETGAPGNHVVAGDILSPQTTERVADRIVEWLETEPWDAD